MHTLQYFAQNKVTAQKKGTVTFFLKVTVPFFCAVTLFWQKSQSQLLWLCRLDHSSAVWR
jgi:hypothetical protein